MRPEEEQLAYIHLCQGAKCTLVAHFDAVARFSCRRYFGIEARSGLVKVRKRDGSFRRGGCFGMVRFMDYGDGASRLFHSA